MDTFNDGYIPTKKWKPRARRNEDDNILGLDLHVLEMGLKNGSVTAANLMRIEQEVLAPQIIFPKIQPLSEIAGQISEFPINVNPSDLPYASVNYGEVPKTTMATYWLKDSKESNRPLAFAPHSKMTALKPAALSLPSASAWEKCGTKNDLAHPALRSLAAAGRIAARAQAGGNSIEPIQELIKKLWNLELLPTIELFMPKFRGSIVPRLRSIECRNYYTCWNTEDHSDVIEISTGRALTRKDNICYDWCLFYQWIFLNSSRDLLYNVKLHNILSNLGDHLTTHYFWTPEYIQDAKIDNEKIGVQLSKRPDEWGYAFDAKEWMASVNHMLLYRLSNVKSAEEDLRQLQHIIPEKEILMRIAEVPKLISDQSKVYEKPILSEAGKRSRLELLLRNFPSSVASNLWIYMTYMMRQMSLLKNANEILSGCLMASKAGEGVKYVTFRDIFPVIFKTLISGRLVYYAISALRRMHPEISDGSIYTSPVRYFNPDANISLQLAVAANWEDVRAALSELKNTDLNKLGGLSLTKWRTAISWVNTNVFSRATFKMRRAFGVDLCAKMINAIPEMLATLKQRWVEVYRRAYKASPSKSLPQLKMSAADKTKRLATQMKCVYLINLHWNRPIRVGGSVRVDHYFDWPTILWFWLKRVDKAVRKAAGAIIIPAYDHPESGPKFVYGKHVPKSWIIMNQKYKDVGMPPIAGTSTSSTERLIAIAKTHEHYVLSPDPPPEDIKDKEKWILRRRVYKYHKAVHEKDMSLLKDLNMLSEDYGKIYNTHLIDKKDEIITPKKRNTLEEVLMKTDPRDKKDPRILKVVPFYAFRKEPRELVHIGDMLYPDMTETIWKYGKQKGQSLIPEDCEPLSTATEGDLTKWLAAVGYSKALDNTIYENFSFLEAHESALKIPKMMLHDVFNAQFADPDARFNMLSTEIPDESKTISFIEYLEPDPNPDEQPGKEDKAPEIRVIKMGFGAIKNLKKAPIRTLSQVAELDLGRNIDIELRMVGMDPDEPYTSADQLSFILKFMKSEKSEEKSMLTE